MSKIFRLYTEGSDTYMDWNDNPNFPYGSQQRQTIEDPDAATARHEITSIPSPFARIDLVKSAFRELTKKQDVKKLDGDTIFHKMVSDTLDVAEIFFNIDKYKNKIEIIKWDPNLMLDELSESDSEAHHNAADSLKKYLKTDAKTYNFDSLQNIYLLNYVNGPEELNIIGATSPATLFFSNANDLTYVNDVFFSNQDIPFDSEYQPLYKRDFEFIKYLFTLRNTIPNFSSVFPEVDEYLELTYKKINDEKKKKELRNVTEATLSNYDVISVVNLQQNDIVEVLGHSLYKKTLTQKECEFTIQSSLCKGVKPLVLPVEAGNKYSELQYTSGKWGVTNRAPFVDSETDLTQRLLPFDGSIGRYLTISDLLEDSIVRVPHNLNKQYFFDGNIFIKENELSYLIPLKKLFFDFFTTEELMATLPDGNKMFEMELLAGDSVKVTLRVPIIGNKKVKYIEYVRIYYNNRDSNIEVNEGGVVEFSFTGMVMPIIRFTDPKNAIYNVTCVYGKSSSYDLSFFNGKNRIQPNDIKSRDENKESDYKFFASNYLIEGQNFDYIVVSKADVSGILVPKFKNQSNSESFEFAIDLGTSNTHIEYKKGGSKTPQVFNINHDDLQLCEFFLRYLDEDGYEHDLAIETELFEKDFLPKIIGEGDFKFPTRTVLSSDKNTDWTNKVDPFLLVNIPFTYDKRQEIPYNKYNNNVKWGKLDDLRVMEAYVRCLMLLMRNKVLLNNGDLVKTKVTWFYPLSMAPMRLEKLKETWNDAYQYYFGSGATNCMSESIAPILYFSSTKSNATNLVNVDIGGGTTDIAFAKNKEIQFVTSFRFAANDLFETPFVDMNETNGIIDYFKNDIRKLMEDKGLTELVEVFDSDNNRIPSNMASFLFGLKENSLVKKGGISTSAIDFNYILRDDENFKIVFVIFYTAIVYHIANIISRPLKSV